MRHLIATGVLLLYFSALFQSTNAAKPELGDMEPVFIFTPGPAPGNCDQYKTDLTTAFREAVDMHTRSIAAINFLNQPMPSHLQPLNRRKWKAWAQLILEVFKIDVDQKKGLQLPSGPAQEIINNFTAVLNAFNYQPPGSGPYKYWIFCSDEFLKYKDPPTAAEIETWGWPSNMAKEKVRSLVTANGYWNATGGTPEHPLSGMRSPAYSFHKTTATSYLCSFSNTHGFILNSSNNTVLVFCPRIFTELPYPTAAKAISDTKFKKPGLKFEDLETYGTTMSHEWKHLVLDLHDEQAVDFFGGELRSLIYGWGRVTQTAIWHPERVRKTPDAFVMFEMGVYYTEMSGGLLQYVQGFGKKYF